MASAGFSVGESEDSKDLREQNKIIAGLHLELEVHSSRSATIGSTVVARRAGIAAAANATKASSEATAPKVKESVALTPNTRLAITRVSAAAPTRPTPMPATASSIPCLTTNPRIFP